MNACGDSRLRGLRSRKPIGFRQWVVHWVSYDVGFECTEVWDDGLADISEIHWGEEMKNIIEDEEKYYDMSGKYRY